MRDLVLETWLREEEESARNTSFPRRRTAPVTNILQWLQCYAGMVGVLSQKFPQMVPELMAYQVTIIKCSRDFEGLAWAQYDWAYRRQAAQTKDLHWSRLNLTLFSLCFTGKARQNIACAHCLSDNHVSDNCPDNPSRSLFMWQYPSSAAAIAPPIPMGRVQSQSCASVISSMRGMGPGVRTPHASLRICVPSVRELIHGRHA